ncbi:MAG: hypothetical protein JXN63_00585 [Candidatus Delongbacteria bacterium]|nr:hypothetical protein [Candidatus Delongbacteria bacterium]
MRYIKIIFLLFTLLTANAQEIELKEKETINGAIDMMYLEQFDEAYAIFNYIKDTYPDHPIGDFFLGFYYNFLASFYETDKFDSKIIIHYNLAEKKAEFHLRFDSGNPWFNYYLGASMVNRGYMLGRDGSRFAGIRKTYSGISYIEDALEKDKSLGDALLLLGTYRFYKASLYSWLIDRRDVALAMIKQSIETSYFSEYAAVSTLGWAYIDYEDYFKAEEVADSALEKYPESHLFLFLKARALYEQKKFELSIDIYLRIKEKLISMSERYSDKDLFNTYYFLTKSYYGLNDTENSKKCLELAMHMNLTQKEKDVLEDRLEDLEDLD